MRGTFANIRLRNQLRGGRDPLPEGRRDASARAARTITSEMSIYDAGDEVHRRRRPADRAGGQGRYGSGSSRDWAAKGTRLLGVRAVIAESFERIHRSNLVGMGVLPLQFSDGESAQSLGLTGHETFSIAGLADGEEVPRQIDGQGRRRAVRGRPSASTPHAEGAALLPSRRHPPVRAAGSCSQSEHRVAGTGEFGVRERCTRLHAARCPPLSCLHQAARRRPARR